MLPENAFTEKEQIALLNLNLTIEMAVACEWIVRDNDHPDTLLTCFISATDDGTLLQASCSCLDGTRNLPCPHALGVLQEVRAQNHILNQILTRRPPLLVA
jgi:SWIM zinc finger.